MLCYGFVTWFLNFYYATKVIIDGYGVGGGGWKRKKEAMETTTMMTATTN